MAFVSFTVTFIAVCDTDERAESNPARNAGLVVVLGSLQRLLDMSFMVIDMDSNMYIWRLIDKDRNFVYIDLSHIYVYIRVVYKAVSPVSMDLRLVGMDIKLVYRM